MLKINEIFFSIQGEGLQTGIPAIFIRLAECNLSCKFCDTDFKKSVEMEEDKILEEVEKFKCKCVILTGGEPLLQDLEQLLIKLTKRGYKIHLETNGTINIPLHWPLFDWVTCSPKIINTIGISPCFVDEWKIIVDKNTSKEQLMEEIDALDLSDADTPILLQPCDDESLKESIQKAVELVKQLNLRLSLQTHKLVGIK